MQKGFQEVWAEMDRAAASPNPTFERQAKVYQAEGVRVVPVPIFPMGEGGLHCLGLAERTAEPPEAGERLAALPARAVARGDTGVRAADERLLRLPDQVLHLRGLRGV